jgi:hypothetical protein
MEWRTKKIDRLVAGLIRSDLLGARALISRRQDFEGKEYQRNQQNKKITRSNNKISFLGFSWPMMLQFQVSTPSRSSYEFPCQRRTRMALTEPEAIV